MQRIASGVAASVTVVLKCAPAYAGTIDTQPSSADTPYAHEPATPVLGALEVRVPLVASPHMLSEPGTLVLFGLGLIILGLIRRRPRH